MKGKVKIISIDQHFLKVLAQYYHNKFKKFTPDFSRTLVIFPSERNKLYFRRYLLDSAGVKGIIPPTMFTIEELINYQYEKIGGERAKVLNDIERNFVLKQTIDELKIEHWKELPFLMFIGIGNRLLNFFDELAQERVTIDEIHQKSTELHFSERYVKDELPILREVFLEYRKNLADAGYRDRIDVYEMVFQRYSSKILEDFDYIAIAGVAATTSLEKMIIKNILSDSDAELILHSGKPQEIISSNDTNSRFYMHYKLLVHLGVNFNQIEVIEEKSSIKPRIHIKALETFTKQTFFLNEIVNEAIKRYSEPHRIGIVLTDESLLFPITEMLKSQDIDYNLSAGIPFTNLILYSFLQHLYEAVKSNLHHKEFFVFLQHPLIKSACINGEEMRHFVYDIKAKMIENKKSYFNIDKKGEQLILPGLESASLNLITFLKKCFSTVSAELKFNVYIDRLIELLNEVLTYNQDVIRANLPGTSDFFDQLHNLVRLRIMPDAIKPGIDMLEFILRILQDGRYHTEGKPLKGVQIIGVLEARNLDFDCIILPFMNEGIFPRRSEKDMFINPALRKILGLPTSQERDNLYYYNFTQLISGKNDVFLLYVNEEKKDIPSRFITMIESDGQYEDIKQAGFIRSAIEIKKHSIKKDEKLMGDLIEKIKKRPLSYVALSAYKKCPYRFYLNYMIGIEEQEEISEEIDPQIWGKIFHNAVREFYVNHFPSGFKDNQINKAQQKFEEIVAMYINSGKYLPLPVRAVAYFDLEVFKIHIRKFLENELLRFQNGYKIFPQSLEGKLVDKIEVGDFSIPLKGYVDRIDMKDGDYYIIDYKTGAIPKKKEYSIGEDFVEFQLPLYALMFSKDEDKRIGGMQYYKIASKPEIREICAQEEVSDYLKAFRNEILVPTIGEILSIEVPFAQTDDKDVCEYCNYCPLCGVGAI